MGGRTISWDPLVIRANERNQASRALEARVHALHKRHYPYQAAPPAGHQIRATLSAVQFLLRDPEARPIVLAALGLEEDQ